MRTLRGVPLIYPDTKGSGDYYAHAISRDQVTMGHDVTVLTTRADELLPRIESLQDRNIGSLRT
ncbi:hypothetical protein DJ73_13275 [Halorubrum sp. Ea1]|uniref:hypothetical protein n=1 Tax=Halorubrum sp. Ea1 TaxID=1480718 RepID=UPI000BD427C1|nr:hypothetical protein [Halorubrum sp. Ea1]OYR51420.1 hypothetical protein DJ73_13275 [Halorubrum sp. Ea1]